MVLHCIAIGATEIGGLLKRGKASKGASNRSRTLIESIPLNSGVNYGF